MASTVKLNSISDQLKHHLFGNHTRNFKHKTFKNFRVPKSTELSMGLKRNRNKSNSQMVYCSENLLQYRNKLLQIVSSREIVYH